MKDLTKFLVIVVLLSASAISRSDNVAITEASENYFPQEWCELPSAAKLEKKKQQLWAVDHYSIRPFSYPLVLGKQDIQDIVSLIQRTEPYNIQRISLMGSEPKAEYLLTLCTNPVDNCAFCPAGKAYLLSKINDGWQLSSDF